MKTSRLFFRFLIVAVGTFLFTASASAQPPTPQNLSVRASGTTVTVSWSTVFGATSYELIAGPTSGSYPFGPFVLPTTGVAVFQNVPVGRYYVRLRTVLGGDRSMPSAEQTVDVSPTNTPTGCRPGAMGELRPSFSYEDRRHLHIEWDPVPGATQYRVSIYVGLRPLMAPLGMTVTQIDQYNVGPGTYTFEVTPYNTCGAGPQKGTVTVTVQ